MLHQERFTDSLTLAAVFCLTLGLLALSSPPDALACDACNEAYKQQLLDEDNPSAAQRDLLRAMENQRGLPLGPLASDARAQADDASRRPSTQAPPMMAGNPPAAAAVVDDIFEDEEFIEIIERDEALDIPPTGYVPQDAEPDKRFVLEFHEGRTYIGQGVVYDGFLTDGMIPGPTIRVQQGDIVEMEFRNTGNVPHGASIHAAYAPTSKHLAEIQPGESASVVFRATYPGVFMYHCAPGGHAIPMHVNAGQYGMIVVEPPERSYQLEAELDQDPDLELYLVQHELYASGTDAVEGNPEYVMFNGKVFRYVEEPIEIRPGDYIRVYFLNVGPNTLSTFHLVGIIWDYVYWQGHPEAVWPGGQTVTAGPSDSWVIEFRAPPDEGSYTILTHTTGTASRGAIGILSVSADAEGPSKILADGPDYTDEEMEEIAEQAARTIAPFGIGTSAADEPRVFGPESEEVNIRIKGNSFDPKVVEIEPGTTVTWTNEDVFTYLAGEFAGLHNAVGISGPQEFATTMLGHAESDSVTFEESGTHDYFCTTHPYMLGRVIVREATEEEEPRTGCNATGTTPADWAVVLLLLAVAATRRLAIG